MNKIPFYIAAAAFFIMGMVFQSSISAEADQIGEVIVKQKTIQKAFNEENPEGNVDLKQIVEQELEKPEECDEPMVTCEIREVSFEITIKKEWIKLNISELNNYDFANTVPKIKNDLTKLTKPETVILQETLARRDLLQNLDGSIVPDRGFFGSLTWLGLLRLAHIKGLDPADPEFNIQLKNQVNDLLEKMGNDQNYVASNPLPSRFDMTPQVGSPLKELWDQYVYLATIAQSGSRVNPGNIPLNSGIDVNIDGFVNVERISD
jgi:hypothetical protein